jgi:hypothetical protein
VIFQWVTAKKIRNFLGPSTRASEVVRRPHLADIPLLSPSWIFTSRKFASTETLQETSGFVNKLSVYIAWLSIREQRLSHNVMAALVAAIHAHPRKAADRVARKVNNLI